MKKAQLDIKQQLQDMQNIFMEKFGKLEQTQPPNPMANNPPTPPIYSNINASAGSKPPQPHSKSYQSSLAY